MGHVLSNTPRISVYGVHRCIDLKVQLINTVSAVFSQIIQPTLSFNLKRDFVLEGWDIAYFAMVLFHVGYAV